MFAIQLTQVGDCLGLAFPEELLTRLKVGKGDLLYMRESANGSITLFPYDPDGDSQGVAHAHPSGEGGA